MNSENMSLGNSARAAVAFREVAAHFSNAEWKLLGEVQRELYKDVMKDVHRALTSLGYKIVNSHVFIRIRKVEDGVRDCQDPGTGVSDSDSSISHPNATPDIVLVIKKEEEGHDWKLAHKVKTETESSTAPPVITAFFSMMMKEERPSSGDLATDGGRVKQEKTSTWDFPVIGKEVTTRAEASPKRMDVDRGLSAEPEPSLWYPETLRGGGTLADERASIPWDLQRARDPRETMEGIALHVSKERTEDVDLQEERPVGVQSEVEQRRGANTEENPLEESRNQQTKRKLSAHEAEESTTLTKKKPVGGRETEKQVLNSSTCTSQENVCTLMLATSQTSPESKTLPFANFSNGGESNHLCDSTGSLSLGTCLSTAEASSSAQRLLTSRTFKDHPGSTIYAPQTACKAELHNLASNNWDTSHSRCWQQGSSQQRVPPCSSPLRNLTIPPNADPTNVFAKSLSSHHMWKSTLEEISGGSSGSASFHEWQSALEESTSDSSGNVLHQNSWANSLGEAEGCSSGSVLHIDTWNTLQDEADCNSGTLFMQNAQGSTVEVESAGSRGTVSSESTWDSALEKVAEGCRGIVHRTGKYVAPSKKIPHSEQSLLVHNKSSSMLQPDAGIRDFLSDLSQDQRQTIRSFMRILLNVIDQESLLPQSVSPFLPPQLRSPQPLPIQPRSVKTHPTQSQLVQPQSGQPHSIQLHPIRESVQPHCIPPHSIQPRSVQPQSVQPQSVHSHSIQPRSVQPHTIHPLSVHPQSSKPQSVPSHSIQPQSVQPHSLKPQSVPSHSVHPRSVNPHSIPSHSVPPQSITPHSIQPQSVHPQSVQPLSVNPHSIPSHSVQPQSIPPHSIHPQSVHPQSVQPESSSPRSIQPRSLQPYILSDSIQPRSVQSHAGQSRSVKPHSGEPQSASPLSVPSQCFLPQSILGPTLCKTPFLQGASSSLRVPLVVDPTLPQRFASVTVDKQHLRKLLMAAEGRVKKQAAFLLNGLIKLLFKKEELARSDGLGLRGKKSNSLDQVTVDAMREFLHSKCVERKWNQLDGNRFTRIITNKISNARRDLKQGSKCHREPKLKPQVACRSGKTAHCSVSDTAPPLQTLDHNQGKAERMLIREDCVSQDVSEGLAAPPNLTNCPAPSHSC